MSSGSLRIQSPNKLDEGLYTCRSRSRLGATSLSSWLHILGRPTRAHTPAPPARGTTGGPSVSGGTGGTCDPAGGNGTDVCPERRNSSAGPCPGRRCHHRSPAATTPPGSASRVRPRPGLTFRSPQVASGSVVGVLGQLRRRVSDEERALRKGL